MNVQDIIVYIDSSIIVINKPPGLRTIPDGYDKEKENLQLLLRNHYPEIMTVHRLDKDTSGLIIFARNKEAHRFLNLQFEKRTINKKYYAIVHNIPDWNELDVSYPLKVNGDRGHRTIVHQTGKKATTLLSKVEKDTSKNLSLLEARPKSGYTHQIRSHLSFIGFPILGDLLYTKNLTNDQKYKNFQMPRLMLHAAEIEFTHPESDKKIILQSDLPFSIKEN